MKYIVITGILIALIGGGIFIVSNQSADIDEEDQNLSSLPFLVTTLKTDVFVKGVDDGDFALIGEEAEAREGASVKTSMEGRSIIESPNKQVTILDRNSEMTIALHTESETSMQLHAGKAWSRIEKALEQGEFYEIETQNAVATVRGTSFGTEYTDSSTIFFVAEGTVITEQIDPVTKKRMPETRMTVRAGSKAVVRSGVETVVSPLTDEDKRKEWYQFNQALVPQIQKSDVKEVDTTDNTDEILESKPTRTPDATSVPTRTLPKTSSFVPPASSLASPAAAILQNTVRDTTEETDPSLSSNNESSTVENIENGSIPVPSIVPEQITDPSISKSPEIVIITDVQPDKTVIGSSSLKSEIVIHGKNLKMVVAVYIGENQMRSFKIVDDSTIVIPTSEINKSGVYTVRVVDALKNVIEFDGTIIIEIHETKDPEATSNELTDDPEPLTDTTKSPILKQTPALDSTLDSSLKPLSNSTLSTESSATVKDKGDTTTLIPR